MRLAASAMLGLFALAGCRPVYGVRAAGALQVPVAPSCVADALSSVTGGSPIESRERRRNGRTVVEMRYSNSPISHNPGRLFLVTGPAGQHAVLSSTWLAGLGSPDRGEARVNEFRQIEARISAQCHTMLVTTTKPCTNGECWALD